MTTIRHSFKYFGILLFVAALLAGCEKDDDDNGNGNGGNGGGNGGGGNPATGEFMTWDVESTTYTSEVSEVFAGNSAGGFGIQGEDANGNTMQLFIFDYNGEGTYNLGGIFNQNIGTFVTTAGQTGYSSVLGGDNSGSIVIDSDDGTTVEGTFSFNGGDVTTIVSITNGAFRATIEN